MRSRCNLLGDSDGVETASVLSIHCCSLDAPILLEEAQELDRKPTRKQAQTPACHLMKEIGQSNQAWNPF